MQSPGFRDTGRFLRAPAAPGNFTPTSLAQLMRCMDPQNHIALPLRVRGAGTSCTDCNESAGGSILHTTGLDRITSVDPYNHTVTAQAGVLLGTLVKVLAEPKPTIKIDELADYLVHFICRPWAKTEDLGQVRLDII